MVSDTTFEEFIDILGNYLEIFEKQTPEYIPCFKSNLNTEFGLMGVHIMAKVLSGSAVL